MVVTLTSCRERVTQQEERGRHHRQQLWLCLWLGLLLLFLLLLLWFLMLTMFLLLVVMPLLLLLVVML